MKLLIHDYAGHGFIAELSRELVLRGHTIIHVYGDHTPFPRGFLEKTPEDSDNLTFHPIVLSAPFKKYSLIRRWFQEREYGRKLAEVVSEHDPDLVISAQTPLDAEVILNEVCREKNIPLIHWLQDVIGVASEKILRKKFPVLGRIIGWYYQFIERYLLNEADAIITISEDFIPILKEWKVSLKKVHFIPNWPPLNYLPVMEKENDWSRKFSLNDSFVFLYTGTLGYKHNPLLLYFLAKSFEHEPEVKVVVISEGPGADLLKKRVDAEGLSNLFILPYQSPENYAQVLATGDVLVGILEHDAGEFSVPSKVLSYFCAQRPIFLSVPEENGAAQLVSRNQAGLVVPPDSLDEFLSGGKELYKNETLRNSYANNGRHYALDNFDIQEIGNKFELIIQCLQDQEHP